MTRMPSSPMPLEVVENTGDRYKMRINLPGFKPEDIKVSLKDRVLTIEAKMEKRSANGSRLYQEISRMCTLPENVEMNNLKSQLTSDGVLAIEAQLIVHEEKPKEIPINHTKQITDADDKCCKPMWATSLIVSEQLLILRL